MMNSEFYDYIVVGSGFSGAICARELALRGKTVLLLEKRNHIAGNMYDYYDNHHLLIHKYGPHVIMTDQEEIVQYISAFDRLIDIEVKMEVNIKNKTIPLPINLNSIQMLYDLKGKEITEKLIHEYGLNQEINILDLLKNPDPFLHSVAEDLYEKVFLGYNIKMWGLSPCEIDKQVIGRAPIRISYNDIRSKKKYNFVPEHGYTSMFEKLLNHPNITIKKNSNAAKVLQIRENKVYIDDIPYAGKVIYTAPLDELFQYQYGHLPYRAIYFKKQIVQRNKSFRSLAVTFPSKYQKYRTSNMNRVTGQANMSNIALVSEYSGQYNEEDKKYNIPSYPIINADNKSLYGKYQKLAEDVANFFYLGRLSEYQYYDMDQTIQRAFSLLKKII